MVNAAYFETLGIPLLRGRAFTEHDDAAASRVAAQSTAQPGFRAQLVGSFGALALALAAIGIFGVLAFSVSQRTREFGMRMALGARSADLLRMLAGSALRIAGAGIAFGLADAAALTRSLA